MTLSRLPLAGVIWIWPREPWWVLGVMVAAALTDVLDGPLARARKDTDERTRRLGAWLDPLCDKLFVLSVLVVLVVIHHVSLASIALIVTRELWLLPMYGIYRLVRSQREDIRFDFRAGLFGKIATVLQFVTVAVGITGDSSFFGLCVATSLVGTIAAGHYLIRGIKIWRSEPASQESAETETTP